MTRPVAAASAALVVGVGGIAVWAVLFAADAPRALLAWLFAFTTGLTVVLGALMLVLITDVVGARWFLVFRGLSCAFAATLPWFALAFVPIAVKSRSLYPAHPEHPVWFGPAGFIARSVLYFAIWIGLARWIRGAPNRKVGGVGTLLVGVTASWASFDWYMSLAPEWSSTIFGVIFCVTSFAAGVCAVAVGAWLSRARARPDHFHALGRLALVGVALWAYMQFSQLLIIWIADLPREVPFYLARSRGVWRSVDFVLVLGHFLVPFLVLLVRPWKRSATLLAMSCMWLGAMHVVDMGWLVLPFRDAKPGLVDLAALAAVLGFGAAITLRVHARRDTSKDNDAELLAAFHYESP